MFYKTANIAKMESLSTILDKDISEHVIHSVNRASRRERVACYVPWQKTN